jgi:hypothetical protein
MSGFTIKLSPDWGADGWVMVPRNILRDRRLSWKAFGLVAFLASHDAEFKINHEFLIQAAADGETSLESGLRELREFGYLRVERQRNERGQLGDSEYVLERFPSTGETPEQAPYTGVSQDQENPDAGKSRTKRENYQRETTKDAAPTGASEDGMLPGMPASPPKPVTGATVVAAFVDGYRERCGAEPPQPMIKKVGAFAKRLLDGSDPAVLVQAARDMAATDHTNLEVQYTRTLARNRTQAPRPKPSEASLKDWLNEQWQLGNAEEVAKRALLYFEIRHPDPDPADAEFQHHQADYQQWLLNHRRQWITANKEQILARLLPRKVIS